jgi:hypothetical protein
MAYWRNTIKRAITIASYDKGQLIMYQISQFKSIAIQSQSAFLRYNCTRFQPDAPDNLYVWWIMYKKLHADALWQEKLGKWALNRELACDFVCVCVCVCENRQWAQLFQLDKTHFENQRANNAALKVPSCCSDFDYNGTHWVRALKFMKRAR